DLAAARTKSTGTIARRPGRLARVIRSMLRALIKTAQAWRSAETLGTTFTASSRSQNDGRQDRPKAFPLRWTNPRLEQCWDLLEDAIEHIVFAVRVPRAS